MSGEALRMKLELARLMRKHRISPAQCSPTAPLPPVEGDWVVEGYAAPAVVDQERTKFAAGCWLPFRKDIPLLFRHGRLAGEVLEVRATDEGLRVRALVRDDEAKRCTHFSIAATVHGFTLRDVDESERYHALVTCATLDEITLTNAPANPAAMVLHRYRQSVAVEQWDVIKRGIVCAQKIVEALRVLNAAQSSEPPARATPTQLAPAEIAPRPRTRTQFRSLVDALNKREGMQP